MSVTLSELRDMVRAGLRDTVLPYHVEDAEVDDSIHSAMTLVSGEMALGETWADSAVTLTVGSDTATLPSTVEYHAVYAMRRHSDGLLLYKRKPEELERMFWDGRTASSAEHEDPTDYCLTEDAGVVTVRFQAPVKAESALDLRRAVLPEDLEDETDSAAISKLLVLAVAKYALAELVGKLTKPELDQLRLDRGAAAIAMQMAQKAIHDEHTRKARLEGVGRPLRFVP